MGRSAREVRIGKESLFGDGARGLRLLPVAFVVLTVGPLIALGVWTAEHRRADRVEEAQTELALLADARVVWLEDHIAELPSLVSLAERLLEVTPAPSDGADPYGPGRLGSVLDLLRTADPSVLGIEVRDESGILGSAGSIRDATPDRRSRAAVISDDGHQVVLAVPPGEDGVLLLVEGPLQRDASTGGHVRLSVHGGDVHELFRRNVGGDASLETVLGVWGADGEPYLAGRLRFEPSSNWRPVSPTDPLPILAALRGEESVSSDLVDYRGVPVFAATRQVAGLDWGVVVKVDRAEAMANAESFVATLFHALGIISLLVVALAVWLARGIMEDRWTLLESNRRLRSLVSDAPFPMLIHAEDGEVLHVNAAWEELSGYGAEELPTIGRWTELAYGQRREAVQEDIDRLYGLDGRIDEGIYMVRTTDGSTRAWEFSSMPLGRLPDGRRTAVSMAADVTTLKEAEAELKASEARLRAMVSNLDGAMYRCLADSDYTMQFLSPRVLDVTGYPARDFIGNRVRSYASIIHPDDLSAVAAEVDLAVRTREPFDLEYRVVAPRDSLRWVKEWGRPVEDVDGSTLLDGFIREYTHERRESLQLELLLAFRRADLSEAESDLIEDGLNRIRRATGSDWVVLSEVGRSPGARILAEAGTRARGVSDEWLAGAFAAARGNGRPPSPTSKSLWVTETDEVHHTITVALDDVGSGTGSLSVGRCRYRYAEDDVRMLEVVGDALWANRDMRRIARRNLTLSAAVEQSPASVVITDRDGLITYVNPKFQEVTGYTSEEVLGRNPRVLKSGTTPREVYEDLWATITAGREWRGVLDNRRKDGTIFREHVSVSGLEGDDGEIHAYVAVKDDVTDRLAMETQLRQAQKMEAVGRLAGGVAHDFNNLLLAIGGHAELLLGDDPGDALAADLTEIREACARGSGLTRQLLAFGRRQVLQPEALDLNEVVREFLPLLGRMVEERVVIEPDLAPDPLPIYADRGQLEQVIMNLVINARDAMPDGGVIEVRTRHEGDSVQLHVRDSGTGIDPDVLPRIFEPFFTTKPASEGTGLGLATVYGIVEQSGGEIRVDSELGEGTTFMIDLPRDRERVTGPRPRPARSRKPREISAASRQDATVLVVDDDLQVRTLCGRVLERAGYDVLTADTPGHAIEVARETERLDLVLADVVMPDMSGPALAARLRILHPDAAHVFMSGYSRELTEGVVLPPESHFLEKPFTIDSLLDVSEAALDAGASRALDTDRR